MHSKCMYVCLFPLIIARMGYPNGTYLEYSFFDRIKRATQYIFFNYVCLSKQNVLKVKNYLKEKKTATIPVCGTKLYEILCLHVNKVGKQKCIGKDNMEYCGYFMFSFSTF